MPYRPCVVTTTMLTMLPGCLWSRQRCAAVCIMYQVPFRLVLMTAFQPFTEKSIAACGNCPPALLMRLSRRPCAAQIASNRALTASGSLMSAICAEALRPRPANWATSASSLPPVAPDHGDMRAQPREQPGDRPPDAAGAARYDNDLILQRTGREHGRVNRKLLIGEAELRRRWIDRSWSGADPCYVRHQPYISRATTTMQNEL